MFHRNRILSILLLLSACCFVHAQEVKSLAGSWAFETDPGDVGIARQWFLKSALADNMLLPGSMTERLKGDEVTVKTRWIGSLYDSSYYYNPAMERYRREGNVKFPFFLTPNRHYVGIAWYNRTFEVTSDGAGRPLQLFLERPHIATRVWLNGVEQEGLHSNSLSVPHIYILKGVKAGTNLLSIRVDNRPETVPVGNDSHSITDQTQGDWNGLVGHLELRKLKGFDIVRLQTFPDVGSKAVRVHVRIVSTGPASKSRKGMLRLSFVSQNSDKHQQISISVPVSTLRNGIYEGDIVVNMGPDVQLWDEFNPALYSLKASFVAGSDTCSRETTFGMRQFEARGKMFYVNGRETMLRGTVENCDFPLTGYPPTDVASWLQVLRTCRSYGLNHIRFHSFCPPEAAFEAADQLGFYLQPEGPSWPNHGIKLGRGEFVDKYLMDEAKAMSEIYGNHPSFCMMAAGNEPAGNWVKWCSAFVDTMRFFDARRLYTGASVGGGWAWQPHSQYHVKAGARGLSEWARTAPETMYDFHNKIDTVSQPYVAHEMGQWCAFPDFGEIEKYTGVTRARNFEIFRDVLGEQGMGDLAHDFLMASGKLQVLCYKHEIERVLRTPGYAGFQMLALNDYSGQGTALVGPLNVFFQSKGYVSDGEFREFCSPLVLLARIPKFTYYDYEPFEARLELANFEKSGIVDAKVCYSISCASENETVDSARPVAPSEVLLQKDIPINFPLPVGNNIKLGFVSCSDSVFHSVVTDPCKPKKMTLRLTLTGRLEDGGAAVTSTNHWDFWVYPRKQDAELGKIYVTDSLDAKALHTLSRGGKVLICAAGKVRYGREVVQHFLPVFWNTSWFKMRPPHTTGLFIHTESPLFREFASDYHSDLQWWELVNRQQVMQFTEFPADFQPIVQSIDTWFLSRKIGMLFEAKVLKGKLMMTTMPVLHANTAVTKQMYKALVDYMNSDAFNPRFEVTPVLIGNLFTKDAPKVNMFTKDSPDELKPKLK